jgi:hypothetical protein
MKSSFLCSADSRIFFRGLPECQTVIIPAHIEKIGRRAFLSCDWGGVRFESVTQLREIGDEAFYGCRLVKFFNVPPSVETIGDRGFARCSSLSLISFGDDSRLKRVGEGAFFESGLSSITIPASLEEID